MTRGDLTSRGERLFGTGPFLCEPCVILAKITELEQREEGETACATSALRTDAARPTCSYCGAAPEAGQLLFGLYQACVGMGCVDRFAAHSSRVTRELASRRP